ncbi:transcriptional regulator [Streptomyces sp. NPDC005722]
MTRTAGNQKLKAARSAAGYHSQQAFADALARTAAEIGLRGFEIGERQIRRWESNTPPWPQGDQRTVLTRLLGQSLEQLGFTPPWSDGTGPAIIPASAGPGVLTAVGLASVPSTRQGVAQPVGVGADYESVTVAHRHLYWSVAPCELLPAVLHHARLGWHLLPQMMGPAHPRLASALAESLLLAGRIQFFDEQQPEIASQTYVQALQAAGEAEDSLIGAAILAHTAFIPGWAGRRDEAAERMTAARTYARRASAPAILLAWLDAVEAECETRCGHPRTALNLLGHAEDLLAAGQQGPTPDWMDWFSPLRLAAFKGNTQLKAGHLPQARETLLQVLDDLPPEDGKQRTVILGDLAAVETASGNVEGACGYAERALDQLAVSWYATGMERVREVRRDMQTWQHEACVHRLDDRLYGWSTTVSALQR